MANQTIGRRRKREKSFVTIEHSMFHDEKLSYKAKGILGYLLTKPDGWVVRVKDLMNHATDGESSVQAGLKELRLNGYLRYFRTKKPNGKWAGIIWEYDDVPFYDAISDKPETIIVNEPETIDMIEIDPQGDFPLADENTPQGDFPLAEDRHAENHPYISNKDFTNKDFNKKELVSSSSKSKFDSVDSIFQKTFKNEIPFEELKAKLIQDSEEGKVQIKTADQYKALMAKRIEFYLQSHPKQSETAQIEAKENNPNESLREAIKANMSHSEKSENVPNVSEGVESNSETTSEDIPKDKEARKKAIEENLKVMREKGSRSAEEVEEAKKEIERMLKQLAEDKKI